MTYVRQRNWVYQQSDPSHVQLVRDRENQDNTVPTSIQWFSQEGPPDVTVNDQKARPRAPTEMAGAFGVRAHSLQCYPIFSYRVFTVLPNVWLETPATH